jgi:hypothetical protein
MDSSSISRPRSNTVIGTQRVSSTPPTPSTSTTPSTQPSTSSTKSAFKPPITRSLSTPILSTTEQSLTQKLADVSTSELSESAKDMPKPSSLGKRMQEQLDGVYKGHHKQQMGGVLSDIKTMRKPDPERADRVGKAVDQLESHLSAKTLQHQLEGPDESGIDALARQKTTLPDASGVTKLPTYDDGNALRGPLFTPTNVNNMVKFIPGIGDVEKSMRSFTLQRNIDSKCRGIAAAAEQQMDGSMGTDLALRVAQKDPTLRDEIAASVGGMRADKYGTQSTYAQLSPAKQQLVDSVLAGYERSISKNAASIGQRLGTEAALKMRQDLAHEPANSDVLFDLSLKTSDDFAKAAAIKLGFTTATAIDQNRGRLDRTLTPEQLAIADKIGDEMAQVAKQQNPNSAGAAIQIPSRYGGNIDAPGTITLNGETYSNPKHLASGGLGNILLYTSSTGKEVVVKSLQEMDQRDEMVAELRAHRHAMGGAGSAGHPNIVGMHGAVQGPGSELYMVMDKAGGGDMNGVAGGMLFATTMGDISPAAKMAIGRHMIKGAAEGLKYLQERNMLHSDIKALNFLLDSDGTVKMSDFGSASIEGTLTSTPLTTVSAPEFGIDMDRKSDLYQLGSMLQTITDGRISVKKEGAAVAKDDATALGRLLHGMLEQDPTKRISVDGVLESSFVKEGENDDPAAMKTLLQASIEYGKAVEKAFAATVPNLPKGIDFVAYNEMLLRTGGVDRNGQYTGQDKVYMETIRKDPEVMRTLTALQEASKAFR